MELGFVKTDGFSVTVMLGVAGSRILPLSVIIPDEEERSNSVLIIRVNSPQKTPFPLTNCSVKPIESGSLGFRKYFSPISYVAWLG